MKIKGIKITGLKRVPITEENFYRACPDGWFYQSEDKELKNILCFQGVLPAKRAEYLCNRKLHLDIPVDKGIKCDVVIAYHKEDDEIVGDCFPLFKIRKNLENSYPDLEDEDLPF